MSSLGQPQQTTAVAQSSSQVAAAHSLPPTVAAGMGRTNVNVVAQPQQLFVWPNLLLLVQAGLLLERPSLYQMQFNHLIQPTRNLSSLRELGKNFPQKLWLA